MILVYIFIAMQVIDGWSTWQVFRTRGGIEANPIVAWLMERLGLFYGLVAAKAFAIGVVLLIQSYGGWNDGLGRGMLILLIIFYAWVLWNNLRILYGNSRT